MPQQTNNHHNAPPQSSRSWAGHIQLHQQQHPNNTSDMNNSNQAQQYHEQQYQQRQQQQQQKQQQQQQQHLTATKINEIHNLLHSELIECNWRDAMKNHAKELIRKKGLGEVTLEELVKELIPVGRASVPEDVKRRVLEEVKRSLVDKYS